jgi:ribosomal protein S4
MFRLRNKHKVCRYFNVDLWGDLRTKQVFNKTFLQFVNQYKERRSPPSPFSRSSVVRRFKRRTAYGELLFFKKKISAFYGGLPLSSVKWSRSQERVIHSLFYNISVFESRLSTLLYRSHFSNSVLHSLSLILSGCVAVNRKVIKTTTYTLKPGDLFEVVDSIKEERYLALLGYLRHNKRFVVYQPRHVELNHSIMSGLLLRIPSYKQTYYPFYLSI